MQEVMTMSQSASLYEKHVDRARHLSNISPACKRIIQVALGEDFDRTLPNDYTTYELHNYVTEYGHKLLNAEIRIVEDVPPTEWSTVAKDERLINISLVLDVRDRAKQKGYNLTMAPDSFALELKYHTIKSEYEEGHIEECSSFLDSVRQNK